MALAMPIFTKSLYCTEVLLRIHLVAHWNNKIKQKIHEIFLDYAQNRDVKENKQVQYILTEDFHFNW
jgi:hypothetical protein